MSQKINVAVDGTAGSGKSFLLKKVAQTVGYELIDTGLMYRAFTYHLFLKNINFNDQAAIEANLENFAFSSVDGKIYLDKTLDITTKLSTNDVLENINQITGLPKVREYMVKLQRELGNKPGVIELGRDITTVVLPDAKLKIYLDAPVEVRAQRRFEQNQAQGINDSYEDVLEKIIARDQMDKNREIGALKIADDAWYIDTSLQSIEEIVKMIVDRIRQLEEVTYG